MKKHAYYVSEMSELIPINLLLCHFSLAQLVTVLLSFMLRKQYHCLLCSIPAAAFIILMDPQSNVLDLAIHG